jgi:hypothetical protein
VYNQCVPNLVLCSSILFLFLRILVEQWCYLVAESSIGALVLIF